MSLTRHCHVRVPELLTDTATFLGKWQLSVTGDSGERAGGKHQPPTSSNTARNGGGGGGR
jgi:hypothetical protein